MNKTRLAVFTLSALTLSIANAAQYTVCLLYTSDAADE